jgi:hypothetical protein
VAVSDVDGAAFALDAPDHVPAIWGADNRVLWAKGEPAMIYGPQGVGKTTIAQQLVLRRIGLGRELLGEPVRPPRTRRRCCISRLTGPSRPPGRLGAWCPRSIVEC